MERIRLFSDWLALVHLNPVILAAEDEKLRAADWKLWVVEVVVESIGRATAAEAVAGC